MPLPEALQEILVGDLFGVEVDLRALGMVSNFVIAGIGCAATGVPDPCCADSLQTPEPGVRTPESPQRKGSSLQFTHVGTNKRLLSEFPVKAR